MHSGSSTGDKNDMNIYSTAYQHSCTHTFSKMNTLKESAVAIELLNAATLILQLPPIMFWWCWTVCQCMYTHIHVHTNRVAYVHYEQLAHRSGHCVCVLGEVFGWECVYLEICQSLELLLIEMVGEIVKQIHVH